MGLHAVLLTPLRAGLPLPMPPGAVPLADAAVPPVVAADDDEIPCWVAAIPEGDTCSLPVDEAALNPIGGVDIDGGNGRLERPANGVEGHVGDGVSSSKLPRGLLTALPKPPTAPDATRWGIFASRDSRAEPNPGSWI